jgi:glycosyltransferase involved in cell wall biosynthesis
MKIHLSIVVPILNEEEGISEFLESTSSALSSLGILYELVLIDDGSQDRTIIKIKEWAREHDEVEIILIKHLINRGHTISLNSGLLHARGEYVLSMDSDLQHPPELIEEFWSARDSADVIVGRQENRKSSKYRLPLSAIFYRLVRVISGISISNNDGDFRLIKKDLLDAISNSHLFWKPIRFLVPKYKISTKSISFNAAERRSGRSKYNFYSLVRFGFNSMLYSTNRPLLFGVALSSFFSLASFIQIGFLLSWYFQGITIPGWTTIVLTITIGFAGISLSLAIISLYLVKAIQSITFGSIRFGNNAEYINVRAKDSGN